MLEAPRTQTYIGEARPRVPPLSPGCATHLSDGYSLNLGHLAHLVRGVVFYWAAGIYSAARALVLAIAVLAYIVARMASAPLQELAAAVRARRAHRAAA